MKRAYRRPRTVKQRLYEHLFFSPDGCWLWTASRAGKYGGITIEGKTEKVHRLSYIIHKGEIPKGLFVCHTCDVRICVNPDHLFLGTCKDNLNDMQRKGRKTVLMGEQCTQSEITEKDVLRVKGLLAIGLMPKLIARCMKISKYITYAIKRGTAWKHVGYPEVCGVMDVSKKHSGYNYWAQLSRKQKDRYNELFSKEPI